MNRIETIPFMISYFPSLGYRYAMWPPFDEPKPEQANRSTQTSPDLSSKWGQVAIGSLSPSRLKWYVLNGLAYLDNKSMRDEVERLLEVCGQGPSTLFLSNEQNSESKSQKIKQRRLNEIGCLQRSRLVNEASCSTMPSGNQM